MDSATRHDDPEPATADRPEVDLHLVHELEAELEEETYWHKYTQELADTRFRTVLLRLPALLRMAFTLSWKVSRLDTVLTVLLQLGGGLLTAAGLLATRGVLESLFTAGPTPDRVWAAIPALAWVSVATAGRAMLSTAAGWAQSRLAPRVKKAAELDLLDTTSRVELGAFDNDAHADDIERARNRGVTSLVMLVNHSVDLLTSGVRFAAVGATLLIIHPLLLPVLIIAALPGGWGAVRSARAAYLAQIQWLARARRSWKLGNTLADRRHAPEVRAFNLRTYLMDRYAHTLRGILTTDLQVAGQQTTARAIGGALSGIGTAGVYLLLGVLLIQGRLPLAAAGTAVFALQTGAGALTQLIFHVNGAFEESLYALDFQRVKDATAGRAERTSHLTTSPPVVVRLDRVSLHYPGADKPALTDVSLTAYAGETIAFVGANGSGKSTIVKLLGCMYPPTTGTIFWNDVDVLDYAPEDLRSHIATVSQDFAHWPFTAGENIHSGEAIAVAAGVGLLKAVIIPLALRRVLAQVPEAREARPLVNVAASMLAATGLTLLAYAAARPLVALAPHGSARAAPVGIAVVLIGFFLAATRRRAISQIIGVLLIDNGIASVAYLATGGVPLVVELGVTADLGLAVLVLQILTTRLHEEFGATDLDELRELHD